MHVVLASESHQQREQVRRTLLSVGLRCENTDCVDYAGLPIRLSRGGVDLVLIGLEKDLHNSLPTIHEACNLSVNRPILAVGPLTESTPVDDVLRSGASGYLDESRMQDDLISTLEHLRRTGVVENRQGTIVALVSAAPGSGVTTLSSGMAFALAQEKQGPVLLAEAGTGVPELALQLNLKPTYTLKQLLQEWERVDATLFRQTLVNHPLGVQVLCASTTGLTPPQISPATMRQLFVLARNLFTRSVFDLGHGLYDDTLEAIQQADDVLIVTRLEIPALHLTRRLLRLLTQEYNIPTSRLQLVGNRGNQRNQLSKAQVEEILGYQLYGLVPEETGTVVLAQNEGRPLQEIAPRGKLCRTLTEMAKRLQSSPAN